jgi:CHAT domain-containing protein
MLRELWLRDRPCLFYMSCCQGAQTGARRDLLNNDLLGLTDGAIMAGVPAVLGFRWPVSDVGARELAILFYSALVDTGRPDHALLSARHKFFARHETDPAWLSPVLVMQP